jgi:hypothetical protein
MMMDEMMMPMVLLETAESMTVPKQRVNHDLIFAMIHQV